MPSITIDERRIPHIFRNARGHFGEDTPVNRRILLDVANRPENFLGTDVFGTDWFMTTLGDGTQIWVHVRDGKITNGGLNPSPIEFLGTL
ncbi:MAG TPA: hypothetical protein VKQ73_01650 [Stellaceae bacterium]|nr:hypothetical protein [Stellaceae bacterium]